MLPLAKSISKLYPVSAYLILVTSCRLFATYSSEAPHQFMGITPFHAEFSLVHYGGLERKATRKSPLASLEKHLTAAAVIRTGGPN